MTSASAAELGFVEEEGSEASSVSLAPDAILSSGFSGTGSGLGSRVVLVLVPASGDAVRSVPAAAIPAAAVPAAVSGVVLGEVSEAAGKVLGSGLSVASGFSLGMAPLASGGFPSIVSASISSQGSEDALLRVSQRDLQRSARESDSGKAVVDSVKGLSAAGAEGLLSQNKEVLTTKPTFSPSLGAWAKPIQPSPDRAAGSLSRSDWPCLSTPPSNHAPRNKDQHSHTRGKVTVSTHQSLPSPLSDEDKKRFPWSAKMDQSVRNLYRATTPIYLEDGTPQVTIPSSVLLQGLENQKEYVLGQF